MSGIVDEMVSRISGEADSYLPLKQGEAGAEQGVRCLAELPLRASQCRALRLGRALTAGTGRHMPACTLPPSVLPRL